MSTDDQSSESAQNWQELALKEVPDKLLLDELAVRMVKKIKLMRRIRAGDIVPFTVPHAQVCEDVATFVLQLQEFGETAVLFGRTTAEVFHPQQDDPDLS